MPSAALLGLCAGDKPASLNKKLLAAALRHAHTLGVGYDLIALDEMRLPLYQSSSVSLPQSVESLRAAVASARGLLIATPALYGSYAPALANALAWLGPETLAGKAVGLLSAATTDDGVRALNALSLVLSYLGAVLIPSPVVLSAGLDAYSADGNVLDTRLAGRVDALSRAVTQFVISVAPGAAAKGGAATVYL